MLPVSHQIFRLESERAQWEQRYLEETAMRQVAIDAASIPKDAKIAALEKSGAESEKVIAEARVERMKQIEEIDVSKVSEICHYLYSSVFASALSEIFIQLERSLTGKFYPCPVDVSPCRVRVSGIINLPTDWCDLTSNHVATHFNHIPRLPHVRMLNAEFVRF